MCLIKALKFPFKLKLENAHTRVRKSVDHWEFFYYITYCVIFTSLLIESTERQSFEKLFRCNLRAFLLCFKNKWESFLNIFNGGNCYPKRQKWANEGILASRWKYCKILKGRDFKSRRSCSQNFTYENLITVNKGKTCKQYIHIYEGKYSSLKGRRISQIYYIIWYYVICKWKFFNNK